MTAPKAKNVFKQLKAAEEELQRKDEELRKACLETDVERHRYYDLFEQAPDAYVVTDIDGKILECNRAAAELLNRKVSQVTGKPVPGFFSLDDRPAVLQLLNLFRESEERQECELRLSPNAGSEPLHAQATVSLVHNAAREDVELRWLLRDVSRRKAAEAALAQSEQRHRFLTEHAQDASYLVRFLPEPHLEYVSPAIERAGEGCARRLRQGWHDAQGAR